MTPIRVTVGNTKLISYCIGSDYWLFTPVTFTPSYSLVMRRESFNNYTSFNSSERILQLLNCLNSKDIQDLINLAGTKAKTQSTSGSLDLNALRKQLQELISYQRLQFFRLNENTYQRLLRRNDPITIAPDLSGQYSKASLDEKRIELTKELGQDAIARWQKKQDSDNTFFTRHVGIRRLLQKINSVQYNFASEWKINPGFKDFGSFVAELSPQEIKFSFNTIKDATGAFQSTLDLAKEGYALFKNAINDQYVRRLLEDYIYAVYACQKTRQKQAQHKLELGLEVTIAIASGGNKKTDSIKQSITNRFGPFTGKALDLIADIGRQSTQKSTVTKQVDDAPAVPVGRAFNRDDSDKNRNYDSNNRDEDKPNNTRRTAAQDRKAISRLSEQAKDAKKQGNTALATEKINQARDILRPHLPKGPEDSWDAVLERLDVASPKNGAVFWSGDPKKAQQYAESINGTTLEISPGGRVIDQWNEINDLPWDEKQGSPPWSGDLWKEVSAKFARGAKGKVSVVQLPKKLWDQGTVWHNQEKGIIKVKYFIDEVTEIEILTVNSQDEFIKLSPNYVQNLMKLKGIPR